MFAKQIADYFGFSKYFDFIGGACMNESRTDKYEVIEYVIESCNITDRNEVVMVGDRSHDMIGAKKAGTAQYRRVVWIWIERRIGTVGERKC